MTTSLIAENSAAPAHHLEQVERQKMTVNKRSREHGAPASCDSKLFSHFRAVGRVSNGVPSAMHYNGGVPYVTTVIGKSFHIYDAESLNILFVSAEVESSITHLTSKDDTTVVLTDEAIHLFDRARLTSLQPIDQVSPGGVVKVEVLGHLLLILFKDSLQMLSYPDLKKVSQIKLQGPSHATTLVHPMTYLNKVIIGFEDGRSELWNIKTEKLIHTFSPFDSAIRTMTGAPVADIVAVGLENGCVCMMDVKKDERLFSLHHQASVTGVSFRTDMGSASQMAVGLGNGSVALWDLETRRLHSTWSAHTQCPVSAIFFIVNQPIILTTAGDNSMKEWIVEGTESRLLKFRSGHSKPPRSIRFYGDDDSDMILSAGRDKAFRAISLVKDSQSSELSQGSIEAKARRTQSSQDEIKLDPIIAFDSFLTKDLKWDNVISAHERSAVARTWRADHKKMGSHELRTLDKSFVTAVAVSSCGNFGLVGTQGGSVDVFNFQSGIHRKHFTLPSTTTVNSEVVPSGAIVGISVDASNQYVVVTCQSGLVAVLEMTNGRTRYTHTAEARIVCTAFNTDSELFAMALSSNEIHILDIQGRLVVRRFAGHSHAITDVLFSHDCRWIISSSLDKTIRTWDLATGLQIDLLTLEVSPISIAFSPVMDFLAVALEDDVAIHLWTNLSMYKPVSFDHVKSYIAGSMRSGQDLGELEGELVQLSLEPKSKWLNLYNLDSIKTRNTPVLPPAAAKKAPFFLDTLLATDARKRDASGEDAVAKDTNSSAEADSLMQRGEEFSTILENESYALGRIFSALKVMSASQIDLEIRSISIPTVEQAPVLVRLIQALTEVIRSRVDYELAITFLNVALKAHASTIRQYPEAFASSISEAQEAVRSTWMSLQESFHQALCLTNFARER